MSICQIPVPSFVLGVRTVFDSMLRILENPDEYESAIAEMSFNSSSRTIDMWGSSFTYPPRRGNSNALIPDDPGLSEREAFPVYDVMDKAFVSVFPGLSPERSVAAGYVKELIRRAGNLFTHKTDCLSTEELEVLKRFFQEITVALEDFPDLPVFR